MKRLICLAVISTAASLLADVKLDQPEWKVTVKVIDETRSAIPAATVGIGYNTNGVPTSIDGLTDSSGVFIASAKGSVIAGYRVEKAGYYTTRISGTRFATYADDKWQPWNPTVEIPLKRVLNPIPMYSKLVEFVMPTNDKPVGLDLTIGDWVEPYGKGKSSDIIFRTQFDKRSERDYDYKLIVSFPNPGDGIQGFGVPYDLRQGSQLRSPHNAPDQGYEQEFLKLDSMRPGQFSKYIWDDKTNYFFRVRTILDEHGAVKSALYGKIYGDFNRFRYYLNPTPNDRNVEFDPKQNLLKGLELPERTDVP